MPVLEPATRRPRGTTGGRTPAERGGRAWGPRVGKARAAAPVARRAGRVAVRVTIRVTRGTREEPARVPAILTSPDPAGTARGSRHACVRLRTGPGRRPS